MPDGGNSLEWVKAILTVVSAVLVQVLGAFLPRLWQDDLRRLQAESETRVKRFEALEKALSVASQAKADLGIEVSIHDLKGELERIMHEFADAAILSREALEEWANKKSIFHTNRPKFSVPLVNVRMARRFRNTQIS